MALPNNARCTDAQFIAVWHEEQCSPAAVARRLNLAHQNVSQRRARIEKRTGIVLPTIPTGNAKMQRAVEFKPAYPREKRIAIENGSVIVSSDAHIWPGEPTTAMQALLNVTPEVRPVRVFANGDWLDGARLSRHARIGWARTPTLTEEREAVQEYAERVAAVALASNPECQFDWNLGNHCMRYDNYLSSRAPELEGEPLTRLEDHFPRWQFQWSTYINADGPHPVMVKHRHAGGVHSGYNNTMKSGVTIATGHTHLLEAKPWGDYRTARRWGVQTGTLADLHSPAFEYHENAPSSACSGFAVLTFHDGELAPPELCEVINGRAWFRNRIVA